MRRICVWILIGLCLPCTGCFRFCDRLRDREREDRCAPTASRCDNPCNSAPSPARPDGPPTYVPTSRYQPDDACRNP